MAKIPSFSSSKNISTSPSRPLLNTLEARIPGEQLAQLGKSVQQFGGQVDQYLQKRKQVDDALKLTDINNRLHMQALSAEDFAKKNPDSAPDGSSIQADFGSVFSEGMKEIDEIKDRSLRARAKEMASSIEMSYRKRLVNVGVEKFNGYVLGKSNELLNQQTFRVQQDPSQLGLVLEEFDAFAEKMPYAGKNGEKFRNAGRRELVTAALESYAGSGKFDDAAAILNNTQAGQFFSVDERKKLTKEFQDRKVKAAKDSYSLENMEHMRMRRQRSDMQRDNEASLFSKMLNADSPQARQEILETARAFAGKQMISMSGLSALGVNQDKIESGESSKLKTNYSVQFLKGASLQTIRPQIISDMEAGRLNHRDGLALLDKLNLQEKREATNPEYKEEKARAKNFIKASVPATATGMFGTLVHGQSEKQMLVKIDEEAARLEQEKGMSPMEAARLASAKVIGLQTFAQSTDHKIAQINNDPEKLKKYREVVQKRVKKEIAAGTISKEAKIKALQTLEEINLRLTALQQKQEYDKLLSIQREKEVSK